MNINKGLSPLEIRAEMILHNVTLTSVAKKAGVTVGAVHKAIYGIGRFKGYRIRPYIAESIGKTVEEIWPQDTKRIIG